MGRIKNKPLTIAISVVSIAIAVIASIMLVKMAGTGERPDKGSFDPYAKEGRLPGYEDTINEEGEESFNYLISACPYFKSGGAHGSIMTENSPGNDYLMTVTYTLKDSGQVVYKSGFIKSGWHIANAPLDIMLDKGIYPAIATITVLEDVTFEPVAEFTQDIDIYISKRP